MLATPPEVMSAQAWQQTPLERQHAILSSICEHLGPNYAVVLAPARTLDFFLNETSLHIRTFVPLGLRIGHQPTQTYFVLVPSGVFPATSRKHELDLLESSQSLTTPSGEHSWESGHLPYIQSLQVELPALSWSNVQLAPFLMAEAPLSVEALRYFNAHAPSPLPVTQMEAQLFPTISSQAVAFGRPQAFQPLLRNSESAWPTFPTEVEWEYACRMGSNTPFYWGSEPPVTQHIARPISHLLYHLPPHPLGLAGLGAYPEATRPPASSQQPHLTRGGALAEAYVRRIAWPWLCSSQRRYWDTESDQIERGYAALRPVIHLPFERPVLPDRVVIPPAPFIETQPASVVMQAMHRITSTEPQTRLQAYSFLRERLGQAQGSFQQCRAALPFLGQLLASTWLPDRDIFLQVLDDLFIPVEYPLSLGCERPLTREASLYQRRRLALDFYPTYIDFVSDPDPALRARATFLFSQLPELEHLLYPRLKQAMQRESIPEVLATQMLSLAHLHRWAKRKQPEDFKVYFESPHPIVAGAARLAILTSTPYVLHYPLEELQPHHAAALHAFCTIPIENIRHFPWGYHSRVALASEWLNQHAKHGPATTFKWLRTLYLEMESQTSAALEEVYLALLQMTFLNEGPSTPATFSETQWSILSDLSRRDFPSAQPFWESAQLPATMGERRRLILRNRGRL